MTRYYVDFSSDLITEYFIGDVRVPDGFRLIERWGPRFSDTERWLVEDDYASDEFEGYLVMPIFMLTLIDDGPEHTAVITEREIQSSRY